MAERHLVVLAAGDRKVALLVEHVEDELTVIHQGFDEDLGGVPGMEGLTVLKDSRLAFLVSVNGLMEMIFHRLERGSVVGPGVFEPARESDSEPRKRILVVEDSQTVREVARHFLGSAGFDVTLAINGEEGLARFQEGGFDLIMTDLDMPRMDGMTMIRAIRSAEGPDKTPILVISYKEDPEDHKAALTAGADRFVNKSEFDSKAVLSVIRDLSV